MLSLHRVHSVFCCCLALCLGLFSSQCHALSLLAGLQNTDATKSLRNEAGITVDIARIPQDLPKIRECRATVDFANKKNLMDSQRRFLEATSVSDGKLKAICVVARGKDGMILGTTDCRIGGKSVTVNNVFVRPDQRGNGIGYLMMEGVEHLVMPQLGATKMTLDVDTNNKPAVKLYEKCGFKISDPANALVSGISSLTGASLQVCMTKNVDAN